MLSLSDTIREKRKGLQRIMLLGEMVSTNCMAPLLAILVMLEIHVR